MSKIVLVLILSLSVSLAFCQEEIPQLSYKKNFIGSSLFTISNLLPDPPSFYQLNYGHRLTAKDALIVEAITWTYKAPLGIPYGPSFESPDEQYPGHVKEIGVGMAYQRFLKKKFYSTIHATPLLQKYYDMEEQKIQNGFQLFMTLRFGYHLSFFKDRFFIEPSVAFTHWPIKTNVPEAFAALDSKWPNYFLFEPGLHFGVKF